MHTRLTGQVCALFLREVVFLVGHVVSHVVLTTINWLPINLSITAGTGVLHRATGTLFQKNKKINEGRTRDM